MQIVSLNSDPAICAKPWYVHRWPWLLMLGPFIVILAGSYTMWMAFSRQDAMVVDDYYKQGKAINQDLRRDRIATALGLSFNSRYDPAAGKLNGMLLSFGAPLAGKISIHLAHATQPEKDLRLAAQLDRHGEFSIALPMLERARWQVLVESERRDWRLAGAWKWPQQEIVAIKADLPPAD
jgi:hypothetical protein